MNTPPPPGHGVVATVDVDDEEDIPPNRPLRKSKGSKAVAVDAPVAATVVLSFVPAPGVLPGVVVGVPVLSRHCFLWVPNATSSALHNV